MKHDKVTYFALFLMIAVFITMLLLSRAHAQGFDPTDRIAFEGGGSNLVRVALRYNGRNPTGLSRQWCGNFVDLTLRQSGHRGGGNLARGYASYGRPSAARVGAIAVMPHHVGIVTAVGPGYVTLVSGNHSGRSGHRTVGLGNYKMSRIIAFRAP